MTVVYGLLAIAVGIWRHLQTGDSMQAVWFGVVLGSVAIIGALMLSRRDRWLGYLAVGLILFSLSVESWWFGRRWLTGHVDGASIRVILILALCVIEAAALVWFFIASTKRRHAGKA